MKYVCEVCGFVYDEELGLPEENIAPGTKFDDLPDDLKLMEMMLACGNLPDNMKTDLSIGISSYKLWDEQITFGGKTTSTQNMDDLYFSFTVMLWKFKNFTLAV